MVRIPVTSLLNMAPSEDGFFHRERIVSNFLESCPRSPPQFKRRASGLFLSNSGIPVVDVGSRQRPAEVNLSCCSSYNLSSNFMSHPFTLKRGNLS